CTSVVFMGTSLLGRMRRGHGGWPGVTPEVSPMSPGSGRVTMGTVSSTASTGTPPAPPPGKTATPALVRRRNGRFVAGVAGGVADHLGVNVLWVRAAFVVLAAING